MLRQKRWRDWRHKFNPIHLSQAAKLSHQAGPPLLGQELVARARDADFPLAALRHEEADICDAAAVDGAIAGQNPTVIVNAAAYNHVDRAEEDEKRTVAANVTGPEVLARICADASIPMIHVSSDYVFDGASARAYREDDPVNPHSAYGRSKAQGETAVREATDHHFILRTAWLFGIYGSNFLKTMVKLSIERDEIKVVSDQVGSPTCTADLAQAILHIARSLPRHRGLYGTYHVAGAGQASRYEFASAIVSAQAHQSGRMPAVVPVTSNAFAGGAERPKFSVLDSTKFERVFGFRPAHWRSATDRTVTALFAKEMNA